MAVKRAVCPLCYVSSSAGRSWLGSKDIEPVKTCLTYLQSFSSAASWGSKPSRSWLNLEHGHYVEVTVTAVVHYLIII